MLGSMPNLNISNIDWMIRKIFIKKYPSIAPQHPKRTISFTNQIADNLSWWITTSPRHSLQAACAPALSPLRPQAGKDQRRLRRQIPSSWRYTLQPPTVQCLKLINPKLVHHNHSSFFVPLPRVVFFPCQELSYQKKRHTNVPLPFDGPILVPWHSQNHRSWHWRFSLRHNGETIFSPALLDCD